MRPDTDWLIFGLGETGLSCARFLARSGESFCVVDSRTQPPALARLRDEHADVPVLLGDIPYEDLSQCRHWLISPGVRRDSPLVRAAIEDGIEVIGDIELFSRHANAPVIAVTGSNGKSTVVSMVGAILREAGLNVRIGGNIGTPALDLLDGPPDCYVLELSSFQLESTDSLQAAATCVLNISPDHLDRYPNFASYAETKHRIYRGATCAVVNADDAAVVAAPIDARQVLRLSVKGAPGAEYQLTDDQESLLVHNERVIDVCDLGVSGEHNIFNALAALALTDTMRVSREHQVRALAQFRGLAHRCQSVATVDDIEWINDSKGTNVGATIAAVRSVFSDRQGVLIAGGQAKDADFTDLAATLRGRVHTTIVYGEDAALIERAIVNDTQVIHAINLDAAVDVAAGRAVAGNAVLLSPACASLDMFSGFEARGDAFVEAVEKVTRR